MALTSMYTGISGLSASSLALSVIGDNIANMNTTAYKASDIQFGDVLSSSLSTGGGSAQVGRGVLAESVTPDFTQGSFSTTSNSLDMAIDGKGFFEVKDSTGTYYTRAGAFTTNKDGNVVDPNGLTLQGYLYTNAGIFAGSTSDINIAALGSSNKPTANMTISDNLDSRVPVTDTSALTIAGTLNSADPMSGTDTNKLTAGGNFDPTTLATYTYDPANPGTTSDATQTVSVTDSTGAAQNLNIYYVDNGAGWDWHVQDAAVPGTDLASGQVTFDGAGAIQTGGAASFSYAAPGTPAQTINLDLSGLTSVAGATSTTLTASNKAFDPTLAVPDPATYDFMSPTTVKDSTGNNETINVYYVKNSATSWTYHAVVPAASSPTGIGQEQSTGTLTFDGTGALTSSPTVSAQFTFAGGNPSQPITLNLAGLSQKAADTASATPNATGFSVADPTGTSQFSTAVTVYDSLGDSHQVTVYFTKTTDSANGNTWAWNAVVNAKDTRSGVDEIQDSGTMSFDASGVLTSSPTSSSTYNFNSGAANQAMTLNFSNFTQYASDSSTVSQAQDGFPFGSLTSLAISQDGVMSGTFSNGQSTSIAKIALANFASPTALTKDGRNLYSPSYGSGGASEGLPETSGRGRIISGSLELSNVDLATQFVNMISAQRMFQANSRVITTTDSLLQEIVQLVR